MKNLLLIGANGQVGCELKAALSKLGRVIPLTRKELDLCDSTKIIDQIREHKPFIIVNAAAYTRVDEAECQPELAFQINGTAPGIMAEEACKLKALLVHFSTDYVFDGSSNVPYTEEDAPNPLNVYGQSKLIGERNIQAVGGPHMILRTSWVYSSHGRNFLKTMLNLAQAAKEINVVDDQKGAPTWSRDLAAWTLTALLFLEKENNIVAHRNLYHLTASGSTSWYGFAKAIFEDLQLYPLVKAISSEKYVAPAKRPLNSLLSTDKFKKKFNILLLDWKTGLKFCLKNSAIE